MALFDLGSQKPMSFFDEAVEEYIALIQKTKPYLTCSDLKKREQQPSFPDPIAILKMKDVRTAEVLEGTFKITGEKFRYMLVDALVVQESFFFSESRRFIAKQLKRRVEDVCKTEEIKYYLGVNKRNTSAFSKLDYLEASRMIILPEEREISVAKKMFTLPTYVGERDDGTLVVDTSVGPSRGIPIYS